MGGRLVGRHLGGGVLCWARYEGVRLERYRSSSHGCDFARILLAKPFITLPYERIRSIHSPLTYPPPRKIPPLIACKSYKVCTGDFDGDTFIRHPLRSTLSHYNEVSQV